jgi:hypothetical protein
MEYDSIENGDPSLIGGYVPVYDREVPTDIRIADSLHGSDSGTLDSLRVKVLVLGEGQNLSTLKIEISSESDLFFHYSHVVNTSTYREIQETQRLMIDFPDYPSVVIKMLNNCIKEPNGFMSVLSVNDQGTGRLDFIQNVEYKLVELMSFDFIQSPHDITKQQISHRYSAMRSKMSALQDRLQEIHAVVKLKNPSLLLQIQRSGPKPNRSAPN